MDPDGDEARFKSGCGPFKHLNHSCYNTAMARKLNPDFMRRTMQKDTLSGLEAVFLTGEQFGVSVSDESLLSDPENGWVDDDAPRRYQRDLKNYRGWSLPGRLYCTKCWRQMQGIPKEIVSANRCTNCSCQLYPADDESWLDGLGFAIYRDRAKRYTGIAVRRFRSLISNGEYILKGERLTDGYHKDHVYPIRAGFENDIPPCVLGAPFNVAVLPAKENLSKGSRCDADSATLLEQYELFIAQHPEWLELVRDSDAREPLFIHQENKGATFEKRINGFCCD